jgi:hypothetical protein
MINQYLPDDGHEADCKKEGREYRLKISSKSTKSNCSRC